MLVGFHLSWTTYGHWFPNDPRGSWSEEAWGPHLAEVRTLDDERKVTRPRPVARQQLQVFLDKARQTLTWPTVRLTIEEIDVVAEAFSEVAASLELEVRACAILANHAHVVTSRHEHAYERTVNRLKGRSAQRVRESRGLKVARDRRERVPIWTRGYWVRYIDSTAQMERAIAYVHQNPVKEGFGLQRWAFVAQP